MEAILLLTHAVKQSNSTHEAQNGKKPVILHPILTAIFPVLAFYTANIDQVGSKVIWRPLVVSLVLALILWGLLWLIFKNLLKSGLLTTWLLIMFFTYGHIRNLVLDIIPTLGRHRFLFSFWILITLYGSWLILKKLGKSHVLNTFLNVFGMTMILIPLLQIGQSRLFSKQAMKRQLEELIPLVMPDDPPDIYYIILDAYARSDVLRGIYGFDNTPFLNQLREMGFYVANCSLANYPSTDQSLASSLNMSYVDDLDNGDERLAGLLKYNKVWSSFRSIGYKTLAFETEFDFLNFRNSDIYIQQPVSRYFNGFEFMLTRTTAMIIFWDELPNDPTGILTEYTREWRDPFLTNKAENDRLILEQLSTFPEIPGPKISYAHITITHPPYVDEKDGSLKYDSQAYVSQIEYVNRQIYKTVQEIIEKSSRKPVIILQADHGPFPLDTSSIQSDYIRMPILNAYLLPQQFMSRLYPEITPVNSFRLVLDALFEGKLGLIEDRSTYYDGKQYLDSWDSCR